VSGVTTPATVLAAVAALAAWLHPTFAGAADTTSGSSTGGSESTGTTTTAGDDAGEMETGPCLTIAEPPCLCACEIETDVDATALALGVLPLLVTRRRTRRELIERFEAEGRLPADVLARLRPSDDTEDPR
jgi:hypothetical protein